MDGCRDNAAGNKFQAGFFPETPDGKPFNDLTGFAHMVRFNVVLCSVLC